jgi:hypothetical protein
VLAGGLVCDGLLCQGLSVFVSMCTFVLTFVRVSGYEYVRTSKQVLCTSKQKYLLEQPLVFELFCCLQCALVMREPELPERQGHTIERVAARLLRACC